MRGLAYLEWCYVRNNLRAIRHSPVRLVLWLLYAVSLVVLCIGRSSRVAPQASSAYGVAHGTAIGVAGSFLLLTGCAIVLGGIGRFAAFRSAAEAVLMSNAGLRPLTIAIWLQLRKSVAGFRSLGAFSYTFLLFAPVHEGLLGTVRAFLATTFVLAIPQTAALPAFLLARGRARRPVIIAGAVLAAFGVVYAIAGFAGRHLFVPLLRATHVDVAILVKAPLLAEPAAFVVPLLLLAAFVSIVAWRGNDALPELYAASNLALARHEGRARQRPTLRARRSTADRPARVPAGALAIVWKNWMTLRRAPGGIASRLAGPALWSVLGLGTAALTRHFADETALAAFEALAGLRIVFWTPISAASGLAAELAQPLFWLSTDALRTRLAAWLLAGSWPAAFAIGCGGAAAASVLDRPLVALCCLPLAALSVCSFKALGIGLYAVFPNPLDAGGPTFLLRLAASVAYLAPAAVVATVAALLLHAGAAGATAVFAVTLGAQGWIVLELVALRFCERGASLATLSRAT